MYHADNIIKVWRLYPFAEEALAPLMSFYCAHTPVHMTMLKTNLCVAFQDHATATYNIVIYNLKDRSKPFIIFLILIFKIQQQNKIREKAILTIESFLVYF